MGFNPRSPRGGATIKFVKSSIVLILFQSTLPTRGSDFNFRSFFKPDYGFNPRSPRGGATIMCQELCKLQCMFQSTLPTRGSDHTRYEAAKLNKMFQSTLPTRGSDPKPIPLPPQASSFNPRSPRGGATLPQVGQRFCPLVSIHAPHEGERPLWESHAS